MVGGGDRRRGVDRPRARLAARAVAGRARRVAGIFGQPAAAIYAVTLLFGALLAWGGAGVAVVVPRKYNGN